MIYNKTSIISRGFLFLAAKVAELLIIFSHEPLPSQPPGVALVSAEQLIWQRCQALLIELQNLITLASRLLRCLLLAMTSLTRVRPFGARSRQKRGTHLPVHFFSLLFHFLIRQILIVSHQFIDYSFRGDLNYPVRDRLYQLVVVRGEKYRSL